MMPSLVFSCVTRGGRILSKYAKCIGNFTEATNKVRSKRISLKPPQNSIQSLLPRSSTSWTAAAAPARPASASTSTATSSTWSTTATSSWWAWRRPASTGWPHSASWRTSRRRPGVGGEKRMSHRHVISLNPLLLDFNGGELSGEVGHQSFVSPGTFSRATSRTRTSPC